MVCATLCYSWQFWAPDTKSQWEMPLLPLNSPASWITHSDLLEERKLSCHPGMDDTLLGGHYWKRCCSSCYCSTFHLEQCGDLCDKRCLSTLDLYSQQSTHQPQLTYPSFILASRKSLHHLWWQVKLASFFMKTFLSLWKWSGICLINLPLVGDHCQGIKARGTHSGTDVHRSRYNCRKKKKGGKIG